jgi:uncharacterized protein (TIGR03067 family)
MRIQVAIVNALLVAASPWASACGDDTAAAALTKIQGTWELVSRKAEGESVPADKIKGTRFIIKDKSFTTKQNGKQIHHGTIKIVEAKGKQMKIDVTYDSGVHKGMTIETLIEWLGDDSFRSCRSLKGTARPTDFSAKKDSGHQLSTLKIVKS